MGEIKFETDEERQIWIGCYRQLLRSGVDPCPAGAADEVLRQLRVRERWSCEGKVSRGPGYTLIVERHLAESGDELEARSARFVEKLEGSRVGLATLHDLQDREAEALAQIEALRLDVQRGNAEIMKLDEVLGEDRQPEAGLVPSTIEAAIMLINRLRHQAAEVRRVLEEIVPDPGKDYDLMNLAHASAAIAESRRAELATREQTDA